RAAGLHRGLERRLARNAQHADPLRAGRQDDDHTAGALPVEGGSRRSAPDGDAGRRVRGLRSPRRVPGNDGMSGDWRSVSFAVLYLPLNYRTYAVTRSGRSQRYFIFFLFFVFFALRAKKTKNR